MAASFAFGGYFRSRHKSLLRTARDSNSRDGGHSRSGELPCARGGLRIGRTTKVVSLERWADLPLPRPVICAAELSLRNFHVTFC